MAKISGYTLERKSWLSQMLAVGLGKILKIYESQCPLLGNGVIIIIGPKS